jgi:hypothetical protein
LEKPEYRLGRLNIMATGVIISTTLSGGVIRPDGSDRLVKFFWKFCADSIGPKTCGHNTCVEFESVFFGGVEHARDVRRLGEVIADVQRSGAIQKHGSNRKSSSHDASLILAAKTSPRAAPRPPRGYMTS